jgi:Spy/CpxP family protein refolding chaperone
VSRTLALTSVAGLLVLGMLIGALGMHVYDSHHGSFAAPPDPFAPVGKLARVLELTPEQLARVDAIVAEARLEGAALHEEMLPRVRAHMERTHQRLVEVLTPEQRAKLDDLHDLHRGGFERFLLGHPHGPRHDRAHHPPPPAED